VDIVSVSGAVTMFHVSLILDPSTI
jgi:hypothetical protein